ncbi:MAG: type IV secretory system conjugative DNA transfer family protein [Propionibacteriaceae bacterium]
MSKKAEAGTAAPEVLTSPYVGRLADDQDPNGDGRNAGRRKEQFALGGPHTLLVGGTGQGKGRRVIMPNIIMFGRNPVIAMSTSGDLVEGTIRKRASRGPVYLLDLCDEVLDSELSGVDVKRVVSDPCALVTNDDEAKMMADTLLNADASGSPNGGGGDDGPWKANAARPLAALLRAGGQLPNLETGQAVPGGGIRWVLQALDDVDNDSRDFITPCWNNAYKRTLGLLESTHAPALRALKNMESRQRESVVLSIRKALDPWTLTTVVGGDGSVAFVPSMLEEQGATLYLVAPMDGSAAGAACAVIEQSIQYWRRRVGMRMPTLGLFLDEIANCAPLVKLPSHISVLRKYRVHLVAAVQTVMQLKRVWGEVGMEEMLRTFPSLLQLPNTPDRETYELASWFEGENERVTSTTDGFGKASHSNERIERVAASELIPRKKGLGRLFDCGAPGVFVKVPDITETDLQA